MPRALSFPHPIHGTGDVEKSFSLTDWDDKLRQNHAEDIQTLPLCDLRTSETPRHGH